MPASDRYLQAIQAEYDRAVGLFPPIASLHEGIAIIREEYLELEANVFARRPFMSEISTEATQLAAMCLRLLTDIVDQGAGDD